MITEKNKQLFFDLLFYANLPKNIINNIDQYISFLKEELSLIEGIDIATIEPEQFSSELKAE